MPDVDQQGTPAVDPLVADQVAGPTEGAVADSIAGQQVIKDEAAAEERAPLEWLDPSYQCDHPVLGRAGTLRIWRFPNGRGIAVTRNFTTSQLTVQPVAFTGVEVTSYDNDGPEVTLGREEDITAHAHTAKNIAV